MCQILKMSYNNGSIVVEISSAKELTNCFFELYIYDFANAKYKDKPNIKQVISPLHMSQDSGIYRFKYEVPNNCRIKCAISDDNSVLTGKERYIGDRHKIKVESELSEIGHLYKIRADINISKKLIFYKSPVSSTKINLPDNIVAGEPLVFMIKEDNIRPKFECYPEFIECFNIEG